MISRTTHDNPMEVRDVGPTRSICVHSEPWTTNTNSMVSRDVPTHIEMVHLDYETTHDNPMEVQAVVMVQYISKS
jgi:hypothetical protein